MTYRPFHGPPPRKAGIRPSFDDLTTAQGSGHDTQRDDPCVYVHIYVQTCHYLKVLFKRKE